MKQLLLIFRHCVQNSILCFLTMYVIETWEKFFHIPKWIADHHFFFYSIFLRANCEYHETKKRFFLKLIWTPEFCCTKKWACVQLLMAEQSDEILHVNITNFSRKLFNFCIIEWRWWVDKLDSQGWIMNSALTLLWTASHLVLGKNSCQWKWVMMKRVVEEDNKAT